MLSLNSQPKLLVTIQYCVIIDRDCVLLHITSLKLAMVSPDFNPSTQESEAGSSL